MGFYFTRYFTRPFLLLHSYFTFWGPPRCWLSSRDKMSNTIDTSY
nr:MAG TPA: hypothetical protein [Caudoviricetes sp.]